MRWSQYLIPTLRHPPAEAPSTAAGLLIRAGYLRPAAAGTYTLLPLAWRMVESLRHIGRELTDPATIELGLPLIEPAGWSASVADPDLPASRPLDTHGHPHGPALAGSAVPACLELAAATLGSYKNLPVCFVTTGPRLAGRPGGGLLRLRETLLTSLCGLCQPQDVERLVRTMLDGLGLTIRHSLPELIVARAEFSGRRGWLLAVATPEGDLTLVTGGSEPATPELAEPAPVQVQTFAPTASLEIVHTPGCTTVEQVAALLQVPPSRVIKTLVYEARWPEERPEHPRWVVACVRGDHAASQAKLTAVLGCSSLAIADPDAARADGFEIGFVGPHLVNERSCRLVIDRDARAEGSAVVGANRAEHHARGFTWERDLLPESLAKASVADIRQAQPGDSWPSGEPMQFAQATVIGRVVDLGTGPAERFGATYLDSNGRAQPFHAVLAEVDLLECIAAVAELHHDADGLAWPRGLGFDALIVTLDVRDEEVVATAERLYQSLREAGLFVLLDDRDQRAGVKFKDADLIGVPYRIAVGRKDLQEGHVQVKVRSTGEVFRVASEKAADAVLQRLRGGIPDR